MHNLKPNLSSFLLHSTSFHWWWQSSQYLSLCTAASDTSLFGDSIHNSCFLLSFCNFDVITFIEEHCCTNVPTLVLRYRTVGDICIAQHIKTQIVMVHVGPVQYVSGLFLQIQLVLLLGTSCAHFAATRQTVQNSCLSSWCDSTHGCAVLQSSTYCTGFEAWKYWCRTQGAQYS